MLLNQLKVLAGDVVLVLLHLGECLLVVVHQLVNVFVFALFDLVDLDLHSQVQLSLQLPQLLFVVFDEAFFGELKLSLELFDSFLKVLLFFLNVSNIRFFANNIL